MVHFAPVFSDLLMVVSGNSSSLNLNMKFPFFSILLAVSSQIYMNRLFIPQIFYFT